MKKDDGITLISLVTTVILIIILASMTTVASMGSYKEIKLENFKAQLEEVQKKVNEISADYGLYKTDSSVIKKYAGSTSAPSYTTYFSDKFGGTPSKYVATDTKFSNLKTACTSLAENDYTFYFSEDSGDIEKYLGLTGISTDIVIDFSTRTVYSVTGCADPEDSSKLYYTASQYGADTVIDSSNAGSNLSSFTGSKSEAAVGTTTMTTVTVLLSRETTGTSYLIENVYYRQNDSSSWIKVDFSQSGDTIKFVVKNAKENVNQVKIVDKYGQTIEGTI
jgi:Tfp pilus assembly protein PilE